MKVTEARLKAALDRPPAEIRLFLFHGPDESAALAHAGRLQKALGEGAERIDLDAGTLRGDPARLSDEAAAISLFGDARWVRVVGAGEEALAAAQGLLTAEQAGNPVVMIAPAVKASGKLVKAALDSDRAMVFACYAPTDRDAATIAIDLARENGLRLSSGAAQRVARAAEGDRAVIAREVEKLALYLDATPDRPADADEAAVAAIGADLNEGEVGAIVEAVVAGDRRQVVEALRRMSGPDASPIPVLRALERRLLQLSDLRGQVDGGEGAEQIVDRARVFWKEKGATVAALNRWTGEALARSLARVGLAQREAIAAGPAGGALAAQVLVQIASSGTRSARR